MARRRQQTGLVEDIMETVSKLPWWIGVMLAIAAYVVFHYFAGERGLPVVAQPGQLAGVLINSWISTVAGIGQYALPLLFLIGAAISAWTGAGKRSGLQQVDPVRQAREMRSGRGGVTTSAAGVAPLCPQCSRTMVFRRAKRGAKAGGGFWGCPGYPSCNGTRTGD